ncbi:helix-turn-helix domain-containing protein [Streptomyces sp. NPDC058619]|uniref:helix-turn-helix domain-containing protein n=1 Tax=unclassified Streptomyces TaxID=2593676 RepID=UPI00365AA1D8
MVPVAQPRDPLPWTPQVLRAPALTDTFQQQPPQTRLTKRWESVQRVLEVLDLVGGAGRSVSAEYLRNKTSLPRTVIERLLAWLCGRGLLTTRSHSPHPRPGSRHRSRQRPAAVERAHDRAGPSARSSPACAMPRASPSTSVPTARARSASTSSPIHPPHPRSMDGSTSGPPGMPPRSA